MAWRAVTRAGQPAVRQALAATWAPAVLRLGPDRIGLGRSTLAVHAGRWLFAAGGARLFSRGPPADIALADVSPEWRAFVAQPFTFDQIPKDALEISYARSSGPGGQNVNRVATKCQIRVSLAHADAWLPAEVIARLRNSPFTTKSGYMVFHSEVHRHQAMNRADCELKIVRAVAEASVLPLATKASTKERIQGYARAEQQRRRADKTKRADKKSDRRSSRPTW